MYFVNINKLRDTKLHDHPSSFCFGTYHRNLPSDLPYKALLLMFFISGVLDELSVNENSPALAFNTYGIV